MVDVLELWSECRVCGSAIRLLDREWHHPEPAVHGAEPELIPRISGHMSELRVGGAGSPAVGFIECLNFEEGD